MLPPLPSQEGEGGGGGGVVAILHRPQTFLTISGQKVGKLAKTKTFYEKSPKAVGVGGGAGLQQPPPPPPRLLRERDNTEQDRKAA